MSEDYGIFGPLSAERMPARYAASDLVMPADARERTAAGMGGTLYAGRHNSSPPEFDSYNGHPAGVTGDVPLAEPLPALVDVEQAPASIADRISALEAAVQALTAMAGGAAGANPAQHFIHPDNPQDAEGPWND